jgi:hypothetical protein
MGIPYSRKCKWFSIGSSVTYHFVAVADRKGHYRPMEDWPTPVVIGVS